MIVSIIMLVFGIIFMYYSYKYVESIENDSLDVFLCSVSFILGLVMSVLSLLYIVLYLF